MHPLYAIMSVGSVCVGLFYRRGGWKNNVGILRSISHKSFMNDGEQIFPLQPLDNSVLVRVYGCRIRLIYIQTHDRRILQFSQSVTQLIDADHTCRRRHEIFPCDDSHIECGRCGQISQRPAAHFFHRTNQRRQTGDQPGRHGAIAIPVQSTALANKWRPCFTISMRQLRQHFH